MTLAIAIFAEDAIVLAADGRVVRPELGGLTIMQEDACKLHGVGAFGIATAGFNGLTKEWMELISERQLLAGCRDVTRAGYILRDFIVEFMQKWEGMKFSPTASLLLVGYEANQRTPGAVSLHSHSGFQPGSFNWVGTPRGGVAADTLAGLLLGTWKDRPSVESAKTFGVLAVNAAHVIDPTVGEPKGLATVTATQGFCDCSKEIAAFQQRSAGAIPRIRAAFRESQSSIPATS